MSHDIQNKAARLFASSVLSGNMNSALATAPASAGNKDRHPLYFLRMERGLTLNDLAEMAGLCHASVSNYERGIYAPSIREAFKLAIALDTTVDRLFGIPYKRNAREELGAR